MRGKDNHKKQLLCDAESIALTEKYLTITESVPIADNESIEEDKPKDETNLICAGDNCTRKFKKDCAFNMCLGCCIIRTKQEGFCDIHYQLKLKKQEEDKIVAEYLQNGNGKKKSRKFLHYEEKFTDFKQTVVIWCFQDYCRNKAWSQDTFKEQIMKRERERRMRRKSSGGEREREREKKRGRGGVSKADMKYAKLKRDWERLIGQSLN
mmetsp:Transcript_12958/g.13029  ORF Transcript_12958/g.13029 Transcript_12958/m.13029 type:complete len:209 (-) Transcript_12958:177-803(-)